MAEAEEVVKPTSESKQVLLRRIMLIVFLQNLSSFILAQVIKSACSSLYTYLETAYLELLIFFVISEILMIATHFLALQRLRGVLGFVLLFLFSVFFVVIFGAILPAMMHTFFLALLMIVVMSLFGLFYLYFFYPQEQLGDQMVTGKFKAHVVVPVSLLISLVMYGVLLTLFHTDSTVQLMVWTFVEGVFILYFGLVLEDIHNDANFGQEDWCQGTIKVYSESVVMLLGAFQSKSGS